MMIVFLSLEVQMKGNHDDCFLVTRGVNER